jgi:DNA invertase Pin-like site-specific DNA recombinase
MGTMQASSPSLSVCPRRKEASTHYLFRHLRRLDREAALHCVVVEFVKEHLTFTGEDSAMSNLLLNVMGAFAKFERSLIKERQREGIALAKKAGVYKGRKPSLTPEQVKTLRERVKAGEQRSALAREFKISRETLYQYVRATA